jgi:hypothetical protein
VDDGVLCNNAIFWRINLNNLELHLSHSSSDCEKVALSNRSISFAEVWSKEDVEQGASEAFDRVGDR